MSRLPGKAVDLIEPSAIAASEDFELIARWVVEGFMHGLHQSPYVGFSTEFASHREYLPGDDLRHLNWKLYGRHDKLYVKQFDAETNLEMHLVLDVSRSMLAGNGRSSKLRFGSMLCAALALLSTRQRDATGITLFADRVYENMKPAGGFDQFSLILSLLAAISENPPAKTPGVLHEIAELMPRRAMVTVISDLFFEEDELQSGLDHFRHFGHEVLVFHLLDPLERRLDVDGSVRFQDMETGEEVVTQAHEIRVSYQQAIEDWIDRLGRACLSREIDYSCLVTDTELKQALLDYFLKRSRLY